MSVAGGLEDRRGDAAQAVTCEVCADAAIEVEVLSVEGGDAACRDGCGLVSTVAVDLVAPVAVGDRLLVHAGVAIGRL